MKTAQQMRNLMPESVVEAILTEFEKEAIDAAKRGATSLRLYGVIHRAGCSASHEIHQYVYKKNPTDLMKKVESRLVEAGYKITAFYEQRQFVDMDIIVSWGDEK
jgi:hypothetical protein